MPDITLCTNRECPMRGDCYRARAVPSELQWVTRYEPRLESNGKVEELICDHFIPIVAGMRLAKTDSFADAISGDE